MAFGLHNFAAASFALWQGTGRELAPPPFDAGANLLWTFVQTMFALGVVCALAYVVLRFVLPRLNLPGARRGMVRVVERTPLDGRRALYVIEVTGRWMLVASSDAGVQLIGELDADAAEKEAEAMKAAGTKMAAAGGRATPGGVMGSPAINSFADRLARAMNRKR